MESNNLKEILNAILGVRCIYPDTLNMTADLNSARIMLENADKDKVLSYEESTEDVIAKVIYSKKTTDKVS
jgi:hypothetical protein